MTPKEIKAGLVRRGHTGRSIAEQLRVAESTVSQVITGRTVSARVRKAIAEAAGVPVNVLWPAATGNGPRGEPKPRLKLHLDGSISLISARQQLVPSQAKKAATA
ncbi:helix-turn-helix domain-containing protein [Piscinibacter sakaiensis]|uniref:helix-turn-helix domain-containing protein n=1 Tax=Piscinibacter sakaiensis TaxID=1547922 RepID=UPI0009EABB39|nr:helix-turn-helix domain-containing protein [Piscinibacter sakaiensis]